MKLFENISEAMSLCLKNGVKIFPVVNGNGMQIQVNNNGSKYTYSTMYFNSKGINEDIREKYLYYAKRIKSDLKKFKKKNKEK